MWTFKRLFIFMSVLLLTAIPVTYGVVTYFTAREVEKFGLKLYNTFSTYVLIAPKYGGRYTSFPLPSPTERAERAARNAQPLSQLKKASDVYQLPYFVFDRKFGDRPNAKNDDLILQAVKSSGSGVYVVRFHGYHGQGLNAYLRLLERRYDKTVPESNCQGASVYVKFQTGFTIPANATYIREGEDELFPPFLEDDLGGEADVTLRTYGETEVHVSNDTNKENNNKDNNNDDDDDDDDDGTPSYYESSSVWSSLASLFDSSALCEIVPSLSMRVPKVTRKRQTFYVVMRVEAYYYKLNEEYRERYGYNYYSSSQIEQLDESQTCAAEIFVERIKSAKAQEVKRILFAILLPCLILLIPMPFLTQYAQLFQDFIYEFDVSYWFWFLPLFLRQAIIDGAVALFLYIKNFGRNRRLRQREEELLRRHEELMRTNEHPALQTETVTIEDGAEPSNHHDEITDVLTVNEPVSSSRTSATSMSSLQDEHGILLMRYNNEPAPAVTGAPPPPLTQTVLDPTTPLTTATTATTTTSTAQPQPEEEEDEHQRVLQREEEEAMEADHSDTVSVTVMGDTEEGEKKNNAQTAKDMLFTTKEEVERVPKGAVDGGSNQKAKELEEEEEEEEKVCRICRDDDALEALVTPCGCTGSVRYIHRTCLDKWRLESAKRNANNFTHCEICKQPYKINIKRSRIAWESSKHIIQAVLLFVVCVVCLSLLAPLIYGTVGELSCNAPYHTVNYQNMYHFTGLFLSVVFYFGLTCIILYAHVIVYTHFRGNAESREYFRVNRRYPPFWTRTTKLKILVLSLVLLLQCVSMGYIIKSFFYYTSTIGWNWETSFVMGTLTYFLYLTFCMATRVNLEDWLAWWRARRAQEVTIVDNGAENTANTATATTATTASAAGEGAPPRSSDTFIPPHDEQDVDYSAHFNVPPEQRVIRAYDFCPPRPVKQEKK